MKITDVTLTLFERDIRAASYGRHTLPGTGKLSLGLLAVETDEGVTGHAFLGSPVRPAGLDAQSLIIALKGVVMGRDPLDREAIYPLLARRAGLSTWRCVGAIDVALWDIAGKVAGLPIYKLIGAARDHGLAYASSPGWAEVGQYVDEAQAVKAAGYGAYKVHPPRTGAAFDLEVARAVRNAVGDDYRLMFDSTGVYTYPEALRVGRELEELGYYWFEDPLPFEDIYNYTKLRQKLDIQIVATELSPGAFHAYAPWVTEKATDALRGDVALKGGITACLKTAHLAEAFRLNYELHHGGNSLNNVANLHVLCAIPNTEFFEVVLPDETQKCGLVEDLKVEPDGTVAVPQGPGLGVEIDFEMIRSSATAILS
jgi:L-alanine-DL-glutamate epimerase-like enolase superfamily enzyme